MKKEKLKNGYIKLTSKKGKIMEKRSLEKFSEVVCKKENLIYYKEVKD